MAGIWTADPGTHAGQFYDRDEVLHRTGVLFLNEALRRRRPAVAVTRRETYDAVIAQLVTQGQLAADEVERRVHYFDLEETLHSFMNGDVVDARRLDEGFHALCTHVGAGGDGPSWILGEIAGTLYRRGNPVAALQVEAQWNTLTAGTQITTLCGYVDVAGVPEAVRGAVCAEHSHMAPHDAIRAFATVYVVDDDASVRRSLARLLTSVSLRVRTFASAESFLAEVDESMPGCLIVDAHLVGMSGSDLQKRLAGARWRLPVIAMSGSHDARVETSALRTGASAFLRKPFDARALLEAIDGVL